MPLAWPLAGLPVNRTAGRGPFLSFCHLCLASSGLVSLVGAGGRGPFLSFRNLCLASSGLVSLVGAAGRGPFLSFRHCPRRRPEIRRAGFGRATEQKRQKWYIQPLGRLTVFVLIGENRRFLRGPPQCKSQECKTTKKMRFAHFLFFCILGFCNLSIRPTMRSTWGTLEWSPSHHRDLLCIVNFYQI